MYILIIVMEILVSLSKEDILDQYGKTNTDKLRLKKTLREKLLVFLINNYTNVFLKLIFKTKLHFCMHTIFLFLFVLAIHLLLLFFLLSNGSHFLTGGFLVY